MAFTKLREGRFDENWGLCSFVGISARGVYEFENSERETRQK